VFAPTLLDFHRVLASFFLMQDNQKFKMNQLPLEIVDMIVDQLVLIANGTSLYYDNDASYESDLGFNTKEAENFPLFTYSILNQHFQVAIE
jgi:hypothetical protein